MIETTVTNNEYALEGFLLVDKPSGITSAHCLERIKHALPMKTKVGHAGTLDSFATGLLVVGLGRVATRELSRVMKLNKRYQATGKLGQLTDTLDFTGTTVQEIPSGNITRQELETAIQSLGKGYHQIPPLYSALKYGGKYLSTLTREQHLPSDVLDTIAQEKGRDITIYNCTLTSYEPPFFSIDIQVSHGTYIRSLLNDIAQKVGSIATTHALRRLAIGPLGIEQATPLASLNNQENIQTACIPVTQLLETIAAYQSQEE
jgi:tRNA pseudouridine55 synthase